MTDTQKEPLFYIHRHASGLADGLPLWWREGDQGYTTRLCDAARMTETRAREICRSPRKYRMYPCDHIDGASRTLAQAALEARVAELEGHLLAMTRHLVGNVHDGITGDTYTVCEVCGTFEGAHKAECNIGHALAALNKQGGE